MDDEEEQPPPQEAFPLTTFRVERKSFSLKDEEEGQEEREEGEEEEGEEKEGGRGSQGAEGRGRERSQVGRLGEGIRKGIGGIGGQIGGIGGQIGGNLWKNLTQLGSKGAKKNEPAEHLLPSGSEEDLSSGVDLSEVPSNVPLQSSLNGDRRRAAGRKGRGARSEEAHNQQKEDMEPLEESDSKMLARYEGPDKEPGSQEDLDVIEGNAPVDLMAESQKKGASVKSSIVNLSNTIVGGGTLAIPFTIKSAGLILGTLFLIFIFFVANISFHLLLLCSKFTNKGNKITYREIAKQAHGWVGTLTSDLSIILSCFGTMCSYFIIISDMTMPLIALVFSVDVDLIVTKWRPLVLTIILLVVIPLACLKKLDSLRFTSFLALVSIGYVVIMVMVRGFQSVTGQGFRDCLAQEGCFTLWNMDADTISAIPIITLAFTGQMNFFTIYSELKAPTAKRMSSVGWGATTVCGTVYLLVSVFGYLTFFDQTKGNILLNYPVNDWLATFSRLAITLTITFSYPLMSHPCIMTFDDLFFSKWAPSRKRWIAEAVALSLAAWLVALLVTDISLVFSFVGATASAAISFILPASCYLSLNPDPRRFTFLKIISYLSLLIGVSFMILRTYTLIAKDILHH